MPQNDKGIYKNIYIHQNFNRNEIREFLLENAQYDSRPATTVGQDKGLLYFDTEINRIIVWNGEDWKIVSYFDDRDLESADNIKLQNIWGESEIVASLTEDEAKGLTGSQDVVQYWENRSTSHIPGTWTYDVPEMQSVIFPKTFVDGVGASYSEFYQPVVKNHLGQVIDCNYTITEDRVGDKTKYRINFLDGKKMRLQQVSPDNPPTATFYSYDGERLTLESINGLVNKFQFLGSDFTVDPNNSSRVRRNLTGTGVTSITDILSLSVNGQELSPNSHYFVYEENLIYYIAIDTSPSGTDWDDEGGLSNDDFIYLNVNDKL
jgi:hypothetical protein